MTTLENAHVEIARLTAIVIDVQSECNAASAEVERLTAALLAIASGKGIHNSGMAMQAARAALAPASETGGVETRGAAMSLTRPMYESLITQARAQGRRDGLEEAARIADSCAARHRSGRPHLAVEEMDPAEVAEWFAREIRRPDKERVQPVVLAAPPPVPAPKPVEACATCDGTREVTEYPQDEPHYRVPCPDCAATKESSK